MFEYDLVPDNITDRFNRQWTGGYLRVEVDVFCGTDYEVPLMRTADFDRLTRFLYQLRTDEELTFDEVLLLFEKSHEPVVRQSDMQ